MRLSLRIASGFAKLKPLKISAITSEKGVKLTSGTDSSSYEVSNALQNFMGSLALCEVAAIKALTKQSKFKVNKVYFKKLESGYNLQKFGKGGSENRIQDINLQAEFQTNGTQQELDELQKKVHNQCPMYCMITAAGIKVNSHWKNVEAGENKENKDTKEKETKDKKDQKKDDKKDKKEDKKQDKKQDKKENKKQDKKEDKKEDKKQEKKESKQSKDTKQKQTKQKSKK